MLLVLLLLINNQVYMYQIKIIVYSKYIIKHAFLFKYFLKKIVFFSNMGI